MSGTRGVSHPRWLAFRPLNPPRRPPVATMTTPPEPAKPDAQRGAVLDPAWEDSLRAGAEAEGVAGSVDAELAIVHLLRHARAPEGLPEPELDAVWSEIDEGIQADAPMPWWRRPMMWLGGTATVAAAAAVVLVFVLPRQGDDPGTQSGTAEVAQGDVRAMAAAVEQQFAVLEPTARKEIALTVEGDRSALRGDLLAMAQREADGTIGGAP